MFVIKLHQDSYNIYLLSYFTKVQEVWKTGDTISTLNVIYSLMYLFQFIMQAVWSWIKRDFHSEKKKEMKQLTKITERRMTAIFSKMHTKNPSERCI